MWGGALGPRMFRHTICKQCGFGFDARTGLSNSAGIWLYRAVTWPTAHVAGGLWISFLT
jgi:hypothetical protein